MNTLIATPCYGGAATTGYLRSLVRYTDVDFLVVEGEAAITRARSNLVSTFLKHTDCDVLAFIDADIEMRPDDFCLLARRVRANKEIVGAAVTMKHRNGTPLSCWLENGEQYTRTHDFDEPFPCKYLGAAVMLIHRSVLEKMWEMYSTVLGYDDPINGPGVHLFHEMIVDRALLTEDYAFCERARAAGVKTWCDPEVVVKHYGQAAWEH